MSTALRGTLGKNVGHTRERFKAHVAARDRPLVVRLEQFAMVPPSVRGPWRARRRAGRWQSSLGKYVDDVGPALDLAVHPLEWVRGRDLGPVLAEKSCRPARRRARRPCGCRASPASRASRVCHDLPLGFGICLVFLGEDRLQHRGHGHALLGRGMGERVAHPVNAAALVRGIEHPPRGGPQALVIIGNDQLHAAQASVGERA